MDGSDVIDMRTRNRLAKILAMTGSDHDGEVLAAARRACSILDQLNLDFSDLLTSSQSTCGNNAELAALRRALAAERRRADALETALSEAEDESGQEASNPIRRSLEQLRLYLMNHMSLKRYERSLLEAIEDPKPSTKEAHIILICAQRYGVNFS